MATLASVRDLKNRTSDLLQQAEKGTLVVVTRRGKPIVTLKPFEDKDLQVQEQYPTTLYDALCKAIEARYPELARRTPEQRRRDFDRISEKIRWSMPFKTWQEMDRAAKGDRYGLTRY